MKHVRTTRGSLQGLHPLREALNGCGSHLRYAMVFSAIINIAYLAPTLFMLGVYDMVVPAGSGATLAFLSIALAATLLVISLLEQVRSGLLRAASLRLDKVFSPLLITSAFASGRKPGDLGLSASLREFDKIRVATTGPAAVAMFDAPWILIYIIACFCLHAAIGLTALLSSTLLLSLALWNERAGRAFAEQGLIASVESAALQDSLGGASEVVRALGMSRTVLARLQTARTAANLPVLQAARLNGRISAAIRFLRLLLQSATLALGAWLAVQHQISGGAIFASSMLAARALTPIDAIVGQWRAMAQALSAYQAIKGLGAGAIDPATILPAPRACLSVKALVIADPTQSRVVLSEVEFAGEGGEIIGVIGASGAGKSTLMQALANARAVGSGDVRLDGARYADWQPDRLGRFIGYVPQDSVLFPGTIRENISRFDTALNENPEVDQNVVVAAKAAGVHNMVLSLPAGYDTRLGVRGAGLSAGQMQRIALARALYGDPSIYVLDEPNANLDAEGEANLIRTMTALRAKGALIIVSAHRFGLIATADKLLVLRAGRMERFGPREEILGWIKAQERPSAPLANRAQQRTANASAGYVQVMATGS